MSDLIYSFSTIWSIPDFNAAIKNIYKILNSNGVAIIELGNKRSINAVCSDCYTRENGWAKLFSTTIGSQLKILKKEGFKILEHRSFQILPYYGNKPAFLRFFLHPNWEKIMRKRIKIFKNKMLDEVVSSLPIISKFAFRHIVVLKKL
jgi:SAM-dependent methyltransferase